VNSGNTPQDSLKQQQQICHLADALSLRVPHANYERCLFIIRVGHLSPAPLRGSGVLRLVIEREKVDSTNGKIIVSRELLGSLLENLETKAAHTLLSPREREGLEQLAVAVMASGEDEIAISGDLLELWRSGG
jgi:hypothetical protein